MHHRETRTQHATGSGWTKPLSVVAFWIMSVLLAGAAVQAQPKLEIKRTVVDWPKVEVYFTVGCNGNPAYAFSKQNFSITDQGEEVQAFSLRCPDPTQRCPISVVLAFDAGESMAGNYNAGARSAGQAFIDLMDGFSDEASVLHFADNVVMAQVMTTDKGQLAAAVSALPAAGEKALWDGAYAGLEEIVRGGKNSCRALVLLTSGTDNLSTNTPQSILALAQKEQIRIYTIALGNATRIDELQLLADRTGGRFFYTTSPGELATIYQEIATEIFWGFLECRVEYTASCADGAEHSVTLALNNFCGGSTKDQTVYLAPYDASTYRELRFGFEKRGGYGRTRITVPMELRTPLSGEVVPPMLFTIKADASCMKIDGAYFDAADLWDSTMATVTLTEQGLLVQVNAGTVVHGVGSLMHVSVLLSEVLDTSCCFLRVSSMQTAYGCFTPVAEAGEVCVWPRLAVLDCTIDAPDVVQWDDMRDTYFPDPFPVTMRVTNSGIEAGWNGRYRITYDSTKVTLISPLSLSQEGNPEHVMPNNVSTAEWTFSPLSRTAPDSTEFCVEATFDNHPPLHCCTRVRIASSQSALQCALTPPELTLDSAQQTYRPWPFLLTAELRNAGSAPLQGVAAEVILPPQLLLGGADAPDSHRKVLAPSWLQPQGTGMATWELVLAPPWPTQAITLPLRVIISSNGGDSSECSVSFDIPAIGSQYAFALAADGPLEICEGAVVTLDAGSGHASYLWSTRDTTRYLTVTRSGAYFCTVSDVSGQTGTSDTLRVVVRPLPVPVLQLSGSNPFCDGDSVTIAAPAGYESYAWSGGERTQSITVRAPGLYSVTVEDSAGCAGVSDTLVLQMVDAPAKPVVTRTTNVLTSSRSSAYQWTRDGSDIPGATNQFLPLTGPGSYTVRIVDENGCVAESDPFTVTVLGVETPPAVISSMQIYPNPTQGLLTVALQLAERGTLCLELQDVLGRVLHHEGAVTEAGSVVKMLQLDRILNGIYLLRVTLNGSMMSRPIRVLHR